MHFSDRTAVVCMLLWCASRLPGWILSRGLRLEVIVKLVTLYTSIQSIQLFSYLISFHKYYKKMIPRVSLFPCFPHNECSTLLFA
jgi:hypothetical protein